MTAIGVRTAVGSGRARLVSLREDSLNTARWRIWWVAAGFAFLTLLALVRISFLGLSGSFTSDTSLEEALLPVRGEITDRNGAPLARAFPAYALWFNPDALGDDGAALVGQPDEVAARLKAIFPDLDEQRVRARLASGKAGYLRRRVLPEEANEVQQIGEIALEVPQEIDRHYPQGMMAAHVLGYVGADGHGELGMERVLDEHLTGDATRGQPIALSIDMRVQGALEDELRRGMKLVSAQGAAGIVLDVDTGEILALASLPEFNPNRIDRAGAANMFNRATNQVYELGSTFKPITVAAAIDAGVVRDFGKQWDATPVKVGRFSITDSHFLGRTLSVPATLIHSSNTVSARIADAMGPERMRRTLMDLGMDERPQIELAARGHPIWPGDDWPRLRNMTVGFGHGIAVTPLHLATAYAAMVNGGVWRPSTLRRVAPGAAPAGRRVFKESTSSRMRQLLRMISKYGTGRSADAVGYRVGGRPVRRRSREPADISAAH